MVWVRARIGVRVRPLEQTLAGVAWKGVSAGAASNCGAGGGAGGGTAAAVLAAFLPALVGLGSLSLAALLLRLPPSPKRERLALAACAPAACRHVSQ